MTSAGVASCSSVTSRATAIATLRKSRAETLSTTRSRASIRCFRRSRASPTRCSSCITSLIVRIRGPAKGRVRSMHSFGGRTSRARTTSRPFRPELAHFGQGQRTDGGPRLQRHELGGDPRAIPVVLRGARPPAAAVGVARAVRPRSLGAAHDGRHAAAQAVLPRRRGAAVAAPDVVPEELPHRGHRGRRHDQAPPHLLPDARQLLGRRLLQAGRRRARLEALDAGLRARSRADLDHRLRRRRGGRPRPRPGGDRRLALDRHPRRAHRAARARRQLLAVRADRAVRALLGAVPGPRARVRTPRATGPATTPSASSSSGTWSSCSTSCTRTARSPSSP